PANPSTAATTTFPFPAVHWVTPAEQIFSTATVETEPLLMFRRSRASLALVGLLRWCLLPGIGGPPAPTAWAPLPLTLITMDGPIFTWPATALPACSIAITTMAPS